MDSLGISGLNADQLQGQTSVDYRGHIYLLEISIIEKKPKNVRNSLMTFEETLMVVLLFFKIRQNIPSFPSFCNDKYILEI